MWKGKVRIHTMGYQKQGFVSDSLVSPEGRATSPHSLIVSDCWTGRVHYMAFKVWQL